MSGDLREQLAALFPAVEHKLLFHTQGCKTPPFNHLTVRETLAKFCADFLPLCPLVDPRGKSISVVKSNFPKLVDLAHKSLSREEFSASSIVACIEDGTFDCDDYHPQDSDRIRALFWLPDVIQDPDAIYRNAHKIVAGDEVYVKVYDKTGSKIKLAFTMDIRKNKKIIRTVVVTSFLTNPGTAMSYVKGEPLYRKQ